MSAKTRTQLKNQSDGTFQNAPPANITPTNHRTFNNDFIDSAANLLTENTFTEDNTFQQKITAGLASGTALEVTSANIDVLQGNISAPEGEISSATAIFDILKFKLSATSFNVPLDGLVDLSSLDGNLITITNPDDNQIWGFVGGLPNTIYYATFDHTTKFSANGLLNAFVINPNDIVIFLYVQSDDIRCLGIKRNGGQEYFVLADYTAYDLLRVNNLWQPGAEYVLDNYYEYPSGYVWSVKVKAIDNSNLDPVAYIRKNAEWIPVLMTNTDLSPGSLPIAGQTNVLDEMQLLVIENNNLEPQWEFGSNLVVYSDANSVAGGLMKSRMFIDSANHPIKRNVLNINTNQTSFFGRIEPSTINTDVRFYAHHGRFITAWGNHPLFENGFNNTDLTTQNSILGNEIGNVSIHDATYMVVNDLVTINASVSCEGKFDQGVYGHEFLLYFPLPFFNFDEFGCGNGAVRFNDISNHETIGAIVSGIDQERCLVAAKWSSAINSATGITINFSFSYITNLN
jgi:hypothetical protein